MLSVLNVTPAALHGHQVEAFPREEALPPATFLPQLLLESQLPRRQGQGAVGTGAFW